jgi:glycosyltransferase involved in cell wall biosynthesis
MTADFAGTAGRRPRAVVLVANPAAPYSRGLRVARSLAAEGYEVEIAAVAAEGLPEEEREGDVILRRYRPAGRWLRWTARPTGSPGIGRKIVFRAHKLASRIVPAVRQHPAPTLDVIRRRLFWPVEPRAWGAALRRDLPPADLYHACGMLTIRIALELGARARRAGWLGRVVYDVIDMSLDSNVYESVSGPVRAFYRWKEWGWVRRADAIVTVNDAIGRRLSRAWRLRRPPVVLMNCQPLWKPPVPRPNLIREATAIAADRRVVLFLGRLGKERGLDEAAAAILRVPDTALVLLGFGSWADRSRNRDADPQFAGRHFSLPTVHPDQVPAWTASADASIIAVPANSLNQRLSTPNKFWESLTAGTPVVIGRDLEVMREIVEADDLGAIADPLDPEDLARALREILDRPATERKAMRERCLRVTRERYNWETAVTGYLVLVRRLIGGQAPANPKNS